MLTMKEQYGIISDKSITYDAQRQEVWIMKSNIARITEMENRLNRLTDWLAKDGELTDDIREDARILDEYCKNGMWRADFEADEAGELPDGLARGVLSEDAAYNALTEFDERTKPDKTAITKSFRNDVYKYISDKYDTEPEFLWQRYPNYAVFRHSDNNKWFAIIMNVGKDKLGLSGCEKADIINVKLDDALLADMLIQENGFFRGYHISRGNWISILLDGTVPLKRICTLIDSGYKATASAHKKQQIRPPKEWIIPANPKYYDIVHAFDKRDTIEWKQGSGARKGDTVFMYVGAPVSAILYKCVVTETDIPFDYTDKSLTIKKLMRIKLEKHYPKDMFTFARLGEEYGIFAVRGPRGIPNSLSAALNGYTENFRNR